MTYIISTLVLDTNLHFSIASMHSDRLWWTDMSERVIVVLELAGGLKQNLEIS